MQRALINHAARHRSQYLHAEVAAVDARTQQVYAGYRQSVLAAFEQVEVSLTSYINARSNLDALDILVDNESRRLALATERYKRGLSPFIDVLDAQRSLLPRRTIGSSLSRSSQAATSR